MRIETKRMRLLLVGAVLLTCGLGLTSCGDGNASQTPSTSSGETETVAPEQGAEPTAPTGLDGEPLPDNWPAEFLVPNGTVVLVQSIGDTGYSVLVEGVDSDQAQGLIGDMVSSGLTEISSIADMGNGEWAAMVGNAEHQASYAYAGGGAGEPNVWISLTPAAE